jgi:hypothetical protein
MSNKDCHACIYNLICDPARKEDVTIIDCCIPEKPLRRLQRIAYKQGGVELYGKITNKYVSDEKCNSRYWSKQNY